MYIALEPSIDAEELEDVEAAFQIYGEGKIKRRESLAVSLREVRVAVEQFS